MNTLYIIGSKNFSQVCQEAQLEEQIRDLIESEFKHTKYHYSGDEFIEYHSEFFKLIAPYYIKANVSKLEIHEVERILNMMNEHFMYNEDAQLTLGVLDVEDADMYFIEKMINQLGFSNFKRIHEASFATR
ncbi:hypothetical protein [Staphylococcus simulans]|uniref:hypothetical protein n=1 Tax=Staphylococcus simulans TaxID=1286 RepID=UPI000D1D85B1|nr:hypothetical protein [Staphylococcus simulans]PTJ36469.1 hypothetical protein BU024_10420 [Staphylococcus simulans]